MAPSARDAADAFLLAVAESAGQHAQGDALDALAAAARLHGCDTGAAGRERDRSDALAAALSPSGSEGSAAAAYLAAGELLLRCLGAHAQAQHGAGDVPAAPAVPVATDAAETPARRARAVLAGVAGGSGEGGVHGRAAEAVLVWLAAAWRRRPLPEGRWRREVGSLAVAVGCAARMGGELGALARVAEDRIGLERRLPLLFASAGLAEVATAAKASLGHGARASDAAGALSWLPLARAAARVAERASTAPFRPPNPHDEARLASVYNGTGGAGSSTRSSMLAMSARAAMHAASGSRAADGSLHSFRRLRWLARWHAEMWSLHPVDAAELSRAHAALSDTLDVVRSLEATGEGEDARSKPSDVLDALVGCCAPASGEDGAAGASPHASQEVRRAEAIRNGLRLLRLDESLSSAHADNEGVDFAPAASDGAAAGMTSPAPASPAPAVSFAPEPAMSPFLASKLHEAGAAIEHIRAAGAALRSLEQAFAGIEAASPQAVATAAGHVHFASAEEAMGDEERHVQFTAGTATAEGTEEHREKAKRKGSMVNYAAAMSQKGTRLTKWALAAGQAEQDAAEEIASAPQPVSTRRHIGFAAEVTEESDKPRRASLERAGSGVFYGDAMGPEGRRASFDALAAAATQEALDAHDRHVQFASDTATAEGTEEHREKAKRKGSMVNYAAAMSQKGTRLTRWALAAGQAEEEAAEEAEAEGAEEAESADRHVQFASDTATAEGTEEHREKAKRKGSMVNYAAAMSQKGTRLTKWALAAGQAEQDAAEEAVAEAEAAEADSERHVQFSAGTDEERQVSAEHREKAKRKGSMVNYAAAMSQKGTRLTRWALAAGQAEQDAAEEMASAPQPVSTRRHIGFAAEVTEESDKPRRASLERAGSGVFYGDAMGPEGRRASFDALAAAAAQEALNAHDRHVQFASDTATAEGTEEHREKAKRKGSMVNYAAAMSQKGTRLTRWALAAGQAEQDAAEEAVTEAEAAEADSERHVQFTAGTATAEGTEEHREKAKRKGSMVNYAAAMSQKGTRLTRWALAAGQAEEEAAEEAEAEGAEEAESADRHVQFVSDTATAEGTEEHRAKAKRKGSMVNYAAAMSQKGTRLTRWALAAGQAEQDAVEEMGASPASPGVQGAGGAQALLQHKRSPPMSVQIPVHKSGLTTTGTPVADNPAKRLLAKMKAKPLHSSQAGGPSAAGGPSMEFSRQGSLTHYGKALGGESRQPATTPLADDPRDRLKSRLKGRVAFAAEGATTPPAQPFGFDSGRRRSASNVSAASSAGFDSSDVESDEVESP